MIDCDGAIHQQVVVDADPARAFELFTAHMTDWWPSDHHIGRAPIEQIVVEPREGGRWYTRHIDGSTTSTGYVRTWEPPSRLVLTWQINADWSFDTALVTTVELTFTDRGNGTVVQLTHSDFDRYGPDADRMRTVFDSPGAWASTLAAFAAGSQVSA